jgi:hypothetical protein
MLNKIKESIERIRKEESVEGYHLSSAYLICQRTEVENAIWQYGFYSEEKDKLLSFKLNEKIEKVEDEPYNHQDTKIEELNLDNVKIDFNEAFDLALERLDKKNDDPKQIITILQVVNGKTIWNISFVTVQFSIYNIKISAEDKEVIKEKYESLLSMRK